MKFMRPRTFIVFALVCLSGAVLLHTSQNVQRAEERLAALRAEGAREEEQLHMLRAEWQALNNPERLERLASEFLDLVPPAPDQMRGVLALPEMVSDEGVVDEGPVLSQPVSFAAPVPQVKPIQKPALNSGTRKSIPRKAGKKPEKSNKTFDAMIGEIGGDS